MAEQQARNSRYLTALDSTRLACLYTSAANLTGTWSKPMCEPYDHPQYWGHYLGHWLSASALSVQSGSGGPALAAKANAMVETMARAQAAWGAAGEPGFLFPYADASPFAALAQGRNCAPVCVPFYVMHKMLAGLLDMHARAGSAQALAVATGLGDWVAAYIAGVLAAGGQASWQSALGTEWGGMNEGLRNLYRATGDSKHATTAGFFVHWAWTDPLVAGVDVLQDFHANTHIPEILGDLQGYMLTGNATELAIVENFLDILEENHTYATGGSNDHEYWGVSRMLGDAMNADTEETCTQYNILKTVSLRFALDGSSRWSDWYARALYGGMIGNQAITGQWADTDTVGFHYMLPLGGAALKKPWGDSAQGFPCCELSCFFHGSAIRRAVAAPGDLSLLAASLRFARPPPPPPAQGWGTSSEAFAGRHIENIFQEAPDHSAVYVNLFEPATLTWPARGAVLSLTAGAPASTSNTGTLTVASPGALLPPTFSVLVRFPAWATSGGNVATLNGAPLPLPPAPGAYLNVTRTWAAGDVLAWYWPAAVRWEPLTDDRAAWRGVGALLFGDILLAGVNTSTDLLQGNDPAKVAEWAVRVPDETALRFTLSADDACGGGGGKVAIAAVPLASVIFEEYTVYWHTNAAPAIAYNGSAVTVIPGAAADWRTNGAASVVGNGADQNIRSGDPGETNAAVLAALIRDPTHSIARVAFSYRYVCGYGADGAHTGTNFDVLLVDVCAAGGALTPPPPAAVKAVVYSSGELTHYPFDKCNTCYSPRVDVDVALPEAVGVANSTAVVIVFYDHDRNVQLDLPMDVSITWA